MVSAPPLRITHAGTLRTITAVAATPISFQRSREAVRHERTTCDETKLCRLMILLMSTLTMSFSMRTGKISRGRRRRRAQDITRDVEGRGVAGTHEAVLGRDPRDGAAEVGALAVEGEEAAVGEPRQVEPPFREGGHRPGFESVHRPGDDHRGRRRPPPVAGAA